MSLNVLAFDQTLGNTGAALLRWFPGGTVSLLDTWHFARPEDDLKGFEATYARAETLRQRLLFLFDTEIYANKLDAIVHETPAVHGYRTESSLLAGYVIRTVIADVHGGKLPVVAVNNQHAKKVITGNAKATKSEVKKAITEKLHFAHPGDGPWNEHTADAAMLGYTYLYDTKEITNG